MSREIEVCVIHCPACQVPVFFGAKEPIPDYIDCPNKKVGTKDPCAIRFKSEGLERRLMTLVAKNECP